MLAALCVYVYFVKYQLMLPVLAMAWLLAAEFWTVGNEPGWQKTRWCIDGEKKKPGLGVIAMALWRVTFRQVVAPGVMSVLNRDFSVMGALQPSDYLHI